MTDGITCRRCGGRIDEEAFELKRKLAERLGHGFKPPVICSDCWLLSIFELAMGEAEEEPQR